MEVMSLNDIRRAVAAGVKSDALLALAEEGFTLAEEVWAATHKDYRSDTPFDPCVLMLRTGGTCSVRLHDLPLGELEGMARG